VQFGKRWGEQPQTRLTCRSTHQTNTPQLPRQA
jgi:hypothetical protein